MLDNKTVLAIIPARAGSKRVPNKNKRVVAGKPLIQYSVDAATNSCYIDRVLISTDDPELVSQYGSEYAPFLRPESVSGDRATLVEVIQHALNWLKENENQVFDLFVYLQPTSPLRTSQHLDEAFQLFQQKDARGVISVSPLGHPIEWCNALPDNLSMDAFLDREAVKRSQDYRPYYMLNGAIYILSVKDFLLEGQIFLKSGTYAYIMNKYHSVDIDDEDDLRLAELLLNSHGS
jgi:N-acylneuraminate cytidylyltransferase